MKKTLSMIFLAALSNAAPAASEHCPPGEPLQWIADYCMAREQTDDLEAARPCMEQASRIRFMSDCRAKRHFKHLLCEITFFRPPEYESVEQCVKDSGFAGPTVRGDGSSGQPIRTLP